MIQILLFLSHFMLSLHLRLFRLSFSSLHILFLGFVGNDSGGFLLFGGRSRLFA